MEPANLIKYTSMLPDKTVGDVFPFTTDGLNKARTQTKHINSARKSEKQEPDAITIAVVEIPDYRRHYSDQFAGVLT